MNAGASFKSFWNGPWVIAAVIVVAVCYRPPLGHAAPETSEATQRGEAFLAGLFNPDLGLLPEYRGAKVYWLFHDNYLAAKVLAVRFPEISKTITSAIHREGIYKSGKIELIFGETEKPLPFHQYQLLDIRQLTNAVIRTEVVVADRGLDGWENYADLRLLACIAAGTNSSARQDWEAAMRMWDGHGFLDAATKNNHQYSTYKLGLALLAASRLSPPAKLPPGLLDRLLAMQDVTGGWITDYDSTGRKIGLANVETTCLCILGLREVQRVQ